MQLKIDERYWTGDDISWLPLTYLINSLNLRQITRFRQHVKTNRLEEPTFFGQNLLIKKGYCEQLD